MKLRRLIAMLDGDVQALYDNMDVPFRPRFYPLVQLLLRDGQASVGELAAATGVTQPAATQTISEMKRQGLLAEVPGPDKRARLLRLTRAGKALAKRLEPVWAATHEAARRLNVEVPLEEVIDAALQGLERRPFRERIVAELERAG